MNNKGQGEFIGALVIILVVVGLIVGIILVATLFLSNGQSTDTAYGYEQSKFWGKLYLKDDHKTVYCIEKDSKLAEIANQASIDKSKIKVTYQEYLFKGTLCPSGDYNAVVVTDIEVLNG